jgi:AcrR family transcriptional regulator
MGRPPKLLSREETISKIKQTATRLMQQQGTAGLSLRAVARALEMTAPAIYNYFPTLDDLLTALIVDSFTALAEAVEAADQQHPAMPPAKRLYAMLMAYRAWAVANPTAFQLIYGTPIPGYHAPAEVTIPLARRPFLPVIAAFFEAYQRQHLILPKEGPQLPPTLTEPLNAYLVGENLPAMPAALVALIISGWGHIHGMVMLELLGHSTPIIGDGEAFYGYEIQQYLSRWFTMG